MVITNAPSTPQEGPRQEGSRRKGSDPVWRGSSRHPGQALREIGEAHAEGVRAVHVDALLRADAGDGAQHGDAVVARCVDVAAAQPGGHAADAEPVLERLDMPAD